MKAAADLLAPDFRASCQLEFVGAEESRFDEFVCQHRAIKTGEILRLDDMQAPSRSKSSAITEADESFSRRRCAMTLGKVIGPDADYGTRNSEP